MKGYLVRMTPLIVRLSGGVFASLSYVRRSLDRGCAGVRALPWVVEAQVVAPVPHWLCGRGSTGRFRQQKRHLVFAPRCLTWYTERIQQEL